MKGQEEGAEQGTVAASTPEVGVQQVGATQPSDELPAGEIAEFGAEESEELAAELLGEAGFEKLTFTGSAQDLKRQWEAMTGYKGLPEKTVLLILQQAAELLQKRHEAGSCLLDITPANTILKDFSCDSLPYLGRGDQGRQCGQLREWRGHACGQGGGCSSQWAPGRTWPWSCASRTGSSGRTSFGEHIFWDFPAGPECDVFSLARTAQELLPPCASRYTRGLLNRMTDEYPEDRPTAAQLCTLLAKHPLLV